MVRDTDWANIMDVMFSAITTADDYIYITTPYFIPNDEIIMALQIASKSGLDVRLLIPDKSDSWMAKHATNSYLQRLFNANIKVYRYTKGFIHAKTMVVDDVFSTIGTSNLDYRSFNINFEINAVFYNTKVSKELKAIYLDDLENATLIDPEAWGKRSNFEKTKEAYAKLWAPLL
ncbi:phospholipase D-like domain-containing protein [Lacinutrix neustonica]|uniref:Phospholipase D-like domain-containing protein n=1 Tax=Lacinutrix neustonica TaxID=2980107 RepID=A0A9E8MV10_9FLAO|nr:phospholipase D-like domain-containing protein [Lacinutrix neustonica]WAC02068.1 phospholipase D-like domain-containing protein [Lacinutrix neustonica]